MEDIRDVIGDSKFDVRACGVLSQDNHILSSVESDGSQTLPGGAVKIGETSKEAVVREFLEETNIRVRVGNLLAVVENMFNYKDKPYQQIIFVYEVFPIEEISDIKGDIEVKWTPKERLNALKPSPLNDIIQQLGTTIRHVINKED